MKTGYIILGVILATGTVACAKPEKEATETPEPATTTEEQGMTDSGENTPEAFEIAPGLTAKPTSNAGATAGFCCAWFGSPPEG